MTCYYKEPCGVCPGCVGITPEDQDTVIAMLSTSPETDTECVDAVCAFLLKHYTDVEPAALIPHFRTMVVESDRPCLAHVAPGVVVSIDHGRLIMVTRQKGVQTCFVSLPEGHTSEDQTFYGGVSGCRSRYTPYEEVGTLSELNRKWIEASRQSHATLSTWRNGDATAQMTDAQAALLGWTRAGDDRRNVTVVPTPDALASARLTVAVANAPTLDGTLITIDGRLEAITSDKLDPSRLPIYNAVAQFPTFDELVGVLNMKPASLKWHLERMIEKGNVRVNR